LPGRAVFCRAANPRFVDALMILAGFLLLCAVAGPALYVTREKLRSIRILPPLIGILFLAGAGALWLHEHDKRIEAEALVEQGMQDLRQSRLRTAAVERDLKRALSTTARALERYDSVRPQVRIVRIPSPRDTAALIVLRDSLATLAEAYADASGAVAIVPPAFVQAADSTRQACSLLSIECERFRVHADSTMAAQQRIIEQLRIIKAPKRRHGLLVDVGLIGAGALIGILAR
jgi:hypothetical protein